MSRSMTGPMREIELPRVRCYRCVYEWTPNHSPIRSCPRCKSKLFDKPKIRPVKLGKAFGINEVIGSHRQAILILAKRYGVKSIKVFGSVRRQEARPDSDVDFLIEWGKDQKPLDGMHLGIELEEILGRRVDVCQEEQLHWAVRPHAVAEAVNL